MDLPIMWKIHQAQGSHWESFWDDGAVENALLGMACDRPRVWRIRFGAHICWLKEDKAVV